MDEEIKPIYGGKPEDFHWAGFGSGSGTNLRECAKVIKPTVIFCDRPKAELLELEELADVPKIVLNGYETCGSWKKAQGNPEAEVAYNKRSEDFNKQILERLQVFEEVHGITIDMVVLGGYMRLVKEPILSAYKDKMINVHPADLTILNPDNTRKYIGDDAVYDAIRANEISTRSSVILVDGGTDDGEILTMGGDLRIWRDFISGTDPKDEQTFKEYAKYHQGIQKERSDWPALTTALEMISQGRIALGNVKVHNNKWRQVYVDRKVVGYGGFQVRR